MMAETTTASSDSPRTPGKLARIYGYLLVGVFILFAGWYLFAVNEDIFFCYWPDQTNYLIYGLAYSHGLGHTYISLASSPKDYIFHHSGFGLLLSPLIRWFGLNIPLLKGFIIVIFFAGLGLYARMISSRGKGSLGWEAAVLTASSPFVVAFPQVILSDLPYLGLSLAALWAFDRWLRTFSLRWLGLSVIIAGAAENIRIAGVMLLFAMMISLAESRREVLKMMTRRRAADFALAAILIIVLFWPVYATMEQGFEPWNLFYKEMSAQKVDGFIVSDKPQPLEMLKIRSINVSRYAGSLTRLFLPWVKDNKVSGILGMALLPFCVVGLISFWRQFRSPHEYYFPAFLVLLFLWAHHEDRYLLPVYPLIFVFSLAGVEMACNRVRRFWAPAVRPLLFLTVLTINLSMVFSSVIDLHPGAGRTHFRKIPLDTSPWLVDAPPWPSIPIARHFRMMPVNKIRADLIFLDLWIRDNLPPTSIVAVNYVSDFYLITGIKCSDPAKPGETMSQYLERTGADYAIISEGFPMYSRPLVNWMRQEPKRFNEVYRVPGTTTALYHLR